MQTSNLNYRDIYIKKKINRRRDIWSKNYRDTGYYDPPPPHQKKIGPHYLLCCRVSKLTLTGEQAKNGTV